MLLLLLLLLLLVELLEGGLNRHAELWAAWLAGSQQGALRLAAELEPAACSRRCKACQQVLPDVGNELTATEQGLLPQQQRPCCFCGDCRPCATRQLGGQCCCCVPHAAQLRQGDVGGPETTRRTVL
jgi:hypothetical protein